MREGKNPSLSFFQIKKSQSIVDNYFGEDTKKWKYFERVRLSEKLE